MPDWVPYIGTVTFDPNFSLEKKEKLIENFNKSLSAHLSYKDDRRYFITVVKEYHKVKINKEEVDDYEAPHLHFILYSTKPLPMYRVRAIIAYYRDTHGRFQFFRVTSLKERQYDEYIRKDIDKNLAATGKTHIYEMNLEENLYDDLEEEYILDYLEDY